ncbi:cutinase [Mycena olivaceomarginata]|nr:cutinase [Mycena olivaceomarginata]KAJ7838204.1 cutinase [Mycena olivaceomarginata]KAJ7866855.1 cutinase [Mycena olivaceomarginata]
MFLTFLLLALSLSALAAPPSTLVTGPSSGCSAIHVITARASTEAPGEGIIGAVVSAVVQGSSHTVSRESVNYPATLTNYDSSESLGVTDMRNKLAAQARSCPSTKIVLMGYSQGAQVTGDTMVANGAGVNQVAAVILMGDPAHVAGESFQKGTANNRNGLFPRSDHGLEQFSAKIASFCDTGDEFCASGISLPVHLGYVQEYGSQAAAFVLGRIGG